MIWLLIVVTLMLMISLYVNVVSFLKLDAFDELFNVTLVKCQSILSTMREIDEGGAFESNDSVGEIFSALVDTVGELREIVYADYDEN